MTDPAIQAPSLPVGRVLAGVLVLLFALPIAALVLATSPAELGAGLQHPHFGPALVLSLRTTVISLVLVVITGAPLAWGLATARSGLARAMSVVVELPVVLPPAVLGVGLLQAFGREGLLGPSLAALGGSLPFTEAAVVLAQVVVSGPFFVQAATNAFRKVEPEALAVARTLGATPREAFFRVAVPIAWPGLVVGASLAWARALGEFGATLLFAGNMPGRTQTMPLAIFVALESDLQLAVVFSLCLVAVGTVLLLAMRVVPRRRREDGAT